MLSLLWIYVHELCHAMDIILYSICFNGSSHECNSGESLTTGILIRLILMLVEGKNQGNCGLVRKA